MTALRQTIRDDTLVGYHYAMGNALFAQGRDEAAVTAYGRALAIDPDHGPSLVNRAEALTRLGRPPEAGNRRGPNDDADAVATATFDLAATFELQGRLAEADEAFARVVALTPDHAEAWTCLGDVQLRLERLVEAEASYRRALEIDPKFPRAARRLDNLANRYAEWAETLATGGEPANAALVYGAALGIAPRREDFLERLAELRIALGDTGEAAEALVRLGLVYQSRLRIAEAARSFELAVTLAPTQAEAHTRHGRALWQLDRLDEAEAAHRHAIALDATLTEAHANLGLVLLSRGALDEALAALRHSVDLDPTFAKGHLWLGVALERSGRLAEAEAAYRRAIDCNPLAARLRVHLGNLLVKLGRTAEAVDLFERARFLNPVAPEAGAGLAGALAALGRMDEAARAELGHGDALLFQRRPEEALAAFRRAQGFAPSLAEAHRRTAEALRILELPGEAEAALRRAIDLDPYFAEAHADLATVLEAQDRNEEAAAARQQARAINPLAYR